MAYSQNGFYITQQMYHKMIFFQDFFMIKEEGNKKLCLLYFLNIAGFLVKGKLFCGEAVAKSTFM
jgi:hypothetical protein